MPQWIDSRNRIPAKKIATVGQQFCSIEFIKSLRIHCCMYPPLGIVETADFSFRGFISKTWDFLHFSVFRMPLWLLILQIPTQTQRYKVFFHRIPPSIWNFASILSVYPFQSIGCLPVQAPLPRELQAPSKAMNRQQNNENITYMRQSKHINRNLNRKQRKTKKKRLT